VADGDFLYDLVLANDRHTTTNVIVYQERPGQGLRGVLWSETSHRWIYAPAIVADILYDDDDPTPTQAADRATAEVAAADALRTELPTEEELGALCEEGERMGWRYGPPES
jgi:hypothetical protein